MYGGFDVYKVYLGVKLHFTTDSYNYIKYGGKTNAKLDTFTKRKDRYFFHKLSKRYNERDILDYFVSNFAVDSDNWIGDLLTNEGAETYAKYRKYKESFRYHFRDDCVRIRDDFSRRRISFDDGFRSHMGQHPRILRLLIQGKVNYQTAIYLDKHLAFFKDWDKTISEKVIWPKISSTITRLKPFLNFNMTEAKIIMKEVFVNE
tara:strand:- start:1326 stop:1937 length:612 start_codon:yes stop_codon:yes gene_type:complete